MHQGFRQQGPQGQRLDQANAVHVNLSRNFLSRHERPPTGPGTTVIVGAGGLVGSLLHAAPVSSIIAISGLIRAAILANFGQQGLSSVIGGEAGGSILNVVTSVLPPPFSLLSYTPTSAASVASMYRGASGSYVSAVSSVDTTADTVTVISITLLLWWLGRPAERRWGPGRFLTYLLVGYAASILAFGMASVAGLTSALPLGASLWMVPSIALLLNSLLLASSSSASINATTLLANLFSFRGFASATLLSYALLLNVTGGVLGGGGSHQEGVGAARFRSGASPSYTYGNSSSPSLLSSVLSLLPFVVAGVAQFYFASPLESLMSSVATSKPKEGGAEGTTAKAPLPPQESPARAGSPPNANNRDEKGALHSLRASVQRFLFTFVCPRLVQPVLFRLVYNGNGKPSGRGADFHAAAAAVTEGETQKNKATVPPPRRNFQRRVITQLEAIGYTRAGTLMTDEEEVLYAAQMQGLAIPRPPGYQPMRQQPQPPPPPTVAARHQTPFGDNHAATNGDNAPLTTEQQEKIDRLLEIGLPGVDAARVRQALVSVGWDSDTAMALLME